LKQEKEKWKTERDAINDLHSLKEQIDQTRTQLEQAQNQGNYNRASELKFGVLPDLEQRLQLAEVTLQEVQAGGSYLREEVTEEDIARVVAQWTGIPVSKMLQSEQERLLTMEDELRQRVLGQDDALSKVADCIRRARADLKDDRQPLGSFLFLGPTGVGKTELAKSLAEFLFDDEEAMIRIDMSEYMEKHSVSRLIGAPPGYVGYDEGGQLTEPIRRRPYSVVLLDEIEKAHPEVFNVLLQVLDDGRLTDGQGRTVNFRNAIVIMTSNIGSEFILEVDEPAMMRQKVRAALHATFRPEFLNRLDEEIIFNKLDRTRLAQIVELQLEIFARRLSRRSLSLEVSDDVKAILLEEGYHPTFGVRPLKRAIQRFLEAPLAKEILAGRFSPGTTVHVECKDDTITFSPYATGFSC
jgi:ATP-dependent Clp protease ATP-binding subunit ClpB